MSKKNGNAFNKTRLGKVAQGVMKQKIQREKENFYLKPREKSK